MIYEQKATVTPREAAEMFQQAGVPIGVDTLQDGLKQGVFPFGVAIERSRWVYIIFRKDITEYLRCHADLA